MTSLRDVLAAAHRIDLAPEDGLLVSIDDFHFIGFHLDRASETFSAATQAGSAMRPRTKAETINFRIMGYCLPFCLSR